MPGSWAEKLEVMTHEAASAVQGVGGRADRPLVRQSHRGEDSRGQQDQKVVSGRERPRTIPVARALAQMRFLLEASPSGSLVLRTLDLKTRFTNEDKRVIRESPGFQCLPFTLEP